MSTQSLAKQMKTQRDYYIFIYIFVFDPFDSSRLLVFALGECVYRHPVCDCEDNIGSVCLCDTQKRTAVIREHCELL